MTDPYPETNEAVDPLIGSILSDGWSITARVARHAKQSGGAFSYGYVAAKGDQQAYVKAFDFEKVFKADDPMKELEKAVKSFNFERDLLSICEKSNLRRIVRAIGNGVIDNASVPFGKLYYLLFELADADARLHVVANDRGEVDWCLFKAKLCDLLPGGEQIAEDLTDLLRYCTAPDPKLRGHPSARRMVNGNPYGLERFVSAFNVLATMVERRAR